MKPNKHINQVIDFLHKNIDFFSAPIKDYKFQKWAFAHFQFNETQLSKEMKLTILPYIGRFYRAICGKANIKHDEEKSLYNGDAGRIKKLLKRHPTITTMFINNMNDVMIDKWYQTRGTIEQKIKRQQSVAERKKQREIAAFHNAFRKLRLSSRPTKSDSPLKLAGREVLRTVKIAPKKQLPRLTQILNRTADVIKKPTNIKKINKHTKITAKAIGINCEWGKYVGYAMLSFLGVAMITLSAVVTISTLGASIPLSTMGFALGGNMILAGLTLGSMATTGTGLATISGMFANHYRKGEIAIACERVTNEAVQIAMKK